MGLIPKEFTQQDAQEHLLKILNFLELRSLSKVQVKSVFNGRQKVENQIGLSLPIVADQSIQACLDAYLKEEVLEDGSSKQLSLTLKDGQAAPRYLTVDLKRFDLTGKKHNVGIELSENLAFQFEGKQESYTLKSIICHIGPSAKAGHYVAYKKVEGTWRMLDDERDDLIDWRDVKEESKKKCYVLVWEKCNSYQEVAARQGLSIEVHGLSSPGSSTSAQGTSASAQGSSASCKPAFRIPKRMDPAVREKIKDMLNFENNGFALIDLYLSLPKSQRTNEFNASIGAYLNNGYADKIKPDLQNKINQFVQQTLGPDEGQDLMKSICGHTLLEVKLNAFYCNCSIVEIEKKMLVGVGYESVKLERDEQSGVYSPLIETSPLRSPRARLFLDRFTDMTSNSKLPPSNVELIAISQFFKVQLVLSDKGTYGDEKLKEVKIDMMQYADMFPWHDCVYASVVSVFLQKVLDNATVFFENKNEKLTNWSLDGFLDNLTDFFKIKNLLGFFDDFGVKICTVIDGKKYDSVNGEDDKVQLTLHLPNKFFKLNQQQVIELRKDIHKDKDELKTFLSTIRSKVFEQAFQQAGVPKEFKDRFVNIMIANRNKPISDLMKEQSSMKEFVDLIKAHVADNSLKICMGLGLIESPDSITDHAMLPRSKKDTKGHSHRHWGRVGPTQRPALQRSTEEDVVKKYKEIYDNNPSNRKEALKGITSNDIKKILQKLVCSTEETDKNNCVFCLQDFFQRALIANNHFQYSFMDIFLQGASNITGGVLNEKMGPAQLITVLFISNKIDKTVFETLIKAIYQNRWRRAENAEIGHLNVIESISSLLRKLPDLLNAEYTCIFSTAPKNLNQLISLFF